MGDWIDDIRRLGELRNEGILTDDEYIKEKNLILTESQSNPELVKSSPQSISKPSEVPIGKKRVRWTTGNKIFLILCSSIGGISQPFLIWEEREYPAYPSDYEPRLVWSEVVFGMKYPEDSIWGGALLVDFFFGGIFYLAVGSILVSIWRKLRN